MQTIYYKTRSYIRHESNLIDLSDYRHKLAAAVGGDCPPEIEAPSPLPAGSAGGDLLRLTRQSPSRRRVRRLALALDLAASLAILILTAAAVVSFLHL